MHIKDKKRAQSIIKIHGQNQVYFDGKKFYLKKKDAPDNAIKIKKENGDISRNRSND